MKFNIFFLCKSFLDSADVTHSLSLSDHISIFNSNKSDSYICCNKILGQIFWCRFNRFAERIFPGIPCICSKLPDVHRAQLNVTHSSFHTRVQGSGRRREKHRCWPFRDELGVWGELFPRCLGGILESRFAHKAALTLSRSRCKALHCSSTSDSGFKLCNPLS